MSEGLLAHLLFPARCSVLQARSSPVIRKAGLEHGDNASVSFVVYFTSRGKQRFTAALLYAKWTPVR